MFYSLVGIVLLSEFGILSGMAEMFSPQKVEGDFAMTATELEGTGTTMMGVYPTPMLMA